MRVFLDAYFQRKICLNEEQQYETFYFFTCLYNAKPHVRDHISTGVGEVLISSIFLLNR